MLRFIGRYGRKLRASLVAVALVLGLTGGTAATVVATATPASAASTYLWNNYSNAVFVAQQVPERTGTFVHNGTSFTMYCWTDSAWTYGNYWTNRYFLGVVHTSIGSFWVWVTASYVHNQTRVGHC